MEYICFEGVDGCGKSSIMDEVVKRLEAESGYKYKNFKTKEPGSPHVPFNQILRESLLNKLFDGLNRELALVLDRLLHFEWFKTLPDNAVVFSDRCCVSNLVYAQLTKLQNPADKQILEDLMYYIVPKFLAWKPLIICIQVDPKTAKKRMVSRSLNRYEREDVIKSLSKLDSYYQDTAKMLNRYGRELADNYELFYVDNDKNMSVTVEKCLEIIQSRLNTEIVGKPDDYFVTRGMNFTLKIF